jgi:chitin disaccharide deacetylase
VLRKLIVSADDFGLSEGLNQAVEEAHLHGFLSSTSVLVNRPASEAVAETSKRCPDLDFGLHVNLTLGRPVSEPRTVPTLVDSSGFFRRDVVRRASLRQVRCEEVFREVRAQVSRLVALGVSPVHWDSHQNVAYSPALVRPIAAACRAEGLRCTRSPRAWIVDRRVPPRLARWKNRLRRPRRLFADAGCLVSRAWLARSFAMPDWRTSPHLVRSGVDYRGAWDEILASLPIGVAEVIAHPVRIEDAGTGASPNAAATRAVDFSVLSDPAVRISLEAGGVTLISFRDLVR